MSIFSLNTFSRCLDFLLWATRYIRGPLFRIGMLALLTGSSCLSALRYFEHSSAWLDSSFCKLWALLYHQSCKNSLHHARGSSCYSRTMSLHRYSTGNSKHEPIEKSQRLSCILTVTVLFILPSRMTVPKSSLPEGASRMFPVRRGCFRLYMLEAIKE